MKLQFIRVTTESEATLNVFDETNRLQVEKAAHEAMARGATIRWQDGREQWIETRQQINVGQPGSKLYNWNKKCDKVRANVYEKTKIKGKVTERLIGVKWVNY